MSEAQELDHTREPVRRTRSVNPRKSSMREDYIDPDTGEPFRRRSKAGDIGAGIFEVPERYRKAGWDYQWATVKVLNEPVDAAVHADMKDAGWRPVTPVEAPDMMPPGWEGKTIERGGQILYKRPAYLSQEARDELKTKADQQLRDKFAAAQMTPAGTAPRHLKDVRTSVEELPADLRAQIAGEVEEV